MMLEDAALQKKAINNKMGLKKASNHITYVYNEKQAEVLQVRKN